MKTLPKVSRRKIGSKPRQNIWRQINKRALREIREAEDREWLKLVAREFPDLKVPEYRLAELKPKQLTAAQIFDRKIAPRGNKKQNKGIVGWGVQTQDADVLDADTARVIDEVMAREERAWREKQGRK